MSEKVIPCEVYSRIVGYHRPVQSWNKGKCEEFKQRLLNQDETYVMEKVLKRAKDKIMLLQELIEKKGGPQDWIVTDIPKKNIMFTRRNYML